MADATAGCRSPSLLMPIALFELRLRIRSPVFAIVVAISLLMVLGSLTVERLRVGPLSAGLRNSAEAVIFVHLVWSLFFLFTAAAFAVEAITRDEVTGFGPILRSTPVRGREHVLGRFLGGFAALTLSFLSIPAGLWLATLAPWVAPGTLGPFRLGPVVESWLLLALPNLFVAFALFVALAATTRSPMAAYLGAVALIVLYGLGSATGDDRQPTLLQALGEPFGFAAYRWATTGWDAAERAARLPPWTGPLLWNRLLWTAVGLGCLAAAPRLFSFAPVFPREAEPRIAPVERPPSRRPASAPSFSWAATLAQLSARTRLEARLVFRSPVFAVLLLLGIGNAAATLWPLVGTARSTLALIAPMDEAFRLAPIVVALFYAGELVWGERGSRVHELVGAAPIPDWVVLAPKTMALILVLAATIGAAALTGIALQLGSGAAGIEPATWLGAFVLPRSYDLTLVAALSIFLQAIAPGKLAGFGLMVLWLIASLALESAGLNGDLYRYGGHGSTLSPEAVGTARALTVRAYWGAFALVLLVLAHQLVGRGVEERLAPRLRRLPGRLAGRAGLLAGAAALAWAALGLYLAGP